MDQFDTAFLEKIESMLNLQARASTPGEAEAASAGITRLLNARNLELADVQARLGAQAPKSEFIAIQFDMPLDAGWSGVLASTLAKFNFCKIFGVQRSKSMTLVGERGNVELVQRLILSTTVSLQRMARDQYRTLARNRQLPLRKYNRRTGTYDVETQAVWSTGFFIGAANGIYDALLEAQTEIFDAHAGSSALVIVKEKELTEAANAHFGDAKFAVGRRPSTRSSSYHTGYAAGRSMNLNTKELT